MAETNPKESVQPQSRLEPVDSEEFDIQMEDYPAVHGTSVDIPEPIIVREWK
ncbi:hypothetical protein [Nocardia sp. NBC_01327]|uniref:hypothetical protein n=1 Tax=Nocardia sp. NBC_01327 TaxID=2903593 RepID=UPI002E13062F|nr:hypothetical protein OG326_21105 [Nocardia sp. NBC_01327]